MRMITCGAVAVCCLALLFLLLPAASCQDKSHSPGVEYKAIAIGADEKDATQKLNELAAEGWEYVGPLGNSLVAFKRVRVTAQDPTAKKELAKWEGSWETGDGEKITIKADHWTWTAPGYGPISGKLRVIEIRGKVTLVDLLVEEGETKGNTLKTILRLEADTLHYCGTYNETRPTVFKTAAANFYYAWKRTQK
jgi:hypothetical protein